MTAKILNYRIPAELERTETIAAAHPDRFSPMRAVAQNLTRRGIAVAKVELVNVALTSFAEVLFDVDPDGIAPNLDVDGRLLIPAPWGRAGGRMWGLRNTEQRAFSWIMRRRSEQQGQPLFVYDDAAKQWLLGRGYTRRTAMAYCRTMPVTLQEWRAAWAATRSTWARQNLGEE